MHVDVTHFLDASEPDADGYYAWYYEGDDYRFTDGIAVLGVRVYTDAPTVAVFAGLDRTEVAASPLTPHAAAYLAERGIATFECLGAEGYEQWKPPAALGGVLRRAQRRIRPPRP
ncbi:MAG: hypothetical protein ACT4QF_01015 [Sporichthyaceae bacterium]